MSKINDNIMKLGRISLIVDPWCGNGCEDFEADVNKIYSDGGEKCWTDIKCEHRKRCQRIKNYLENYIKNKN